MRSHGHWASFPKPVTWREYSTPAASGSRTCAWVPLEADWTDVDLDGFLTGRATEVPFLPHVSYYFIRATVTRNRNHPLGLLVGDLLVQFRSASGNGHRRRLPFDINNGHHIGGLNHFDLLSHPDVYNQLQHWLRALDADHTNQTMAAPIAGLVTNPSRLLSDIDA